MSEAGRIPHWDCATSRRPTDVPGSSLTVGGQKVVDDVFTIGGCHKEISLLPLLPYSAPGGLRQDPGRAAESAAGPRTDEERGHDVRVLLSTDGGRGDEPLVGLAVRLRALGAEARVCAPPGWSGGRQREMRTYRTRGSTLRETPVIRPASAAQRSTAASEVSR